MNAEKLEHIYGLLENNKPDAALKALKTVRLAPGMLKGNIHFIRGEAWRLKGIFNKAIKEYANALKAGLPTAELFCRALIRSAACYRALGHQKMTFAFAAAAVKAASKVPGIKSEAELELAMAYRLKGDFAKSSAMLNRLLRNYRKQRDHEACAFILWALGGLYRLEGRYAEAIRAFENSISSAIKAGDEFSRGYAIFGLGGVLRVAGFMKRARASYAGARKIFAGTGDIFARAYAECGFANVLRQEGELEEAFKGYRRAHRLYSSIDDKPDLGFVEWGLGEIYKKRGDFSKAMKCFKTARRLFDGHAETRGEVLCELSMANIHYLEGRTSEADHTYFAAVAKARKHGLHTYLETFT